MQEKLSNDDLQRIVEGAGLPEDFGLELYAVGVLDAFQQARKLELQRQRVKSQRKTLEGLARDSDKVADGLGSLRPEVREALLDRQVDLPSDLLSQLTDALHGLSEGARGLLEDETALVRGVRPEAGLKFAIKELYDVFRDWFPTEVGYSRRDELEHGYEGRFYDLIRLLLDEFGIHKTPQAVGKAIERALKV